MLAGQSLFVKPVKVLGDANFIGTASNPLVFDSQGPNVIEGRELQLPEEIALDTSTSATAPIVYIADTLNNRVLAFQYATQLKAGAFADLVLGQPDRFTTLAGGSSGLSTSLRFPSGMAVDSAGNLYVADTGNNRVLRFPRPFSQPAGQQGGAEFPDLIIGQTSFTGTSANSNGVTATTLNLLPGGGYAGPTGLAIDSSGNLWVADTGNNRALRFPAGVLKAGQNAPAADLAVGQADLISSAAQTTRNAKTGLSSPNGIAFDPKGRMLVTDHLDRVVVFPAGAGFNATAMRILGVDTTVSAATPTAINLGFASGVTAGGYVIVADTSNNRVMVFGSVDSWSAESTQFSPTALEVLGQTTFKTGMANGGNPAPGAAVLNDPTGVSASGSELFIADAANNRVLVFPASASVYSQSASRVIGQLDFPYNAPNLVEGKEFYTAVSAALSGSAVLDQSASPPHLYVADTGNNRILGFRNFTAAQSGQAADIVIGQPDLFHTQVNYPSGLSTQPGATGLNGPTSLAVDSAGNLFVADSLNARVLRFPSPFASGKAAGESANLVIGQADFVSQITVPTTRTLTTPVAVSFTQKGLLAVADYSANRVLFFPTPFTSGMNATVVLGQSSFTASASGSGQAQLSAPESVGVDPQDRVLVADAGNSRIQIYPAVGSLAGSASPASFAVTAGLSQPVGIAVESNGQFWVADSAQNSLFHFASIDNLPLANPAYSSDAALPALAPHSAYADTYNNLVVADGINRVLYFVPQVNVVNAANYIPGRALAPGTIASVFPAVSTNIVSMTTQPFSVLPLSGTLADTQVLVNGTAAPLIYVSPGQINLVLSNSLAQGGVANVQVLRPSTGQVYGGAEIPLASASPALFVLGGLQSGPVAALNQDNSVNSGSNPVVRGQTIQLYGTGQGLVPNAPADGQQAPTNMLLPTAILPQVLLGSTGSAISVPASNIASSLAPGYVGLWQINVQIPTNAPTGSTVPITIFMNGIPSFNPAMPTQVVTTIAIK